jgi:hypothetical protein
MGRALTSRLNPCWINGRLFGQGRQSRDKTIGKGHVFCARWPLRRGLERQHVGRVVSALDAREPQEAVNQQPATNEQHDGHRDFRDDEGAPDSMTHVLLAEHVRLALT